MGFAACAVCIWTLLTACRLKFKCDMCDRIVVAMHNAFHLHSGDVLLCCVVTVVLLCGGNILITLKLWLY